MYRFDISFFDWSRRVLELAILGLLKDGPLHGYELKKRLGETVGQLWGVSYGSLYPALTRLDKAGAIEEVGQREAPAPIFPATGSISGEAAAARLRRGRAVKPGRRTRRAYRITERGNELFGELLVADASSGTDEDRAFALKLAFCKYLPPEARLELLHRRRAYLADKLSRARKALSRRQPGTESETLADPYARSLMEHGTQTTVLDLEWVDDLIARESRGGAPS